VKNGDMRLSRGRSHSSYTRAACMIQDKVQTDHNNNNIYHLQ